MFPLRRMRVRVGLDADGTRTTMDCIAQNLHTRHPAGDALVLSAERPELYVLFVSTDDWCGHVLARTLSASSS